ncbi:MAG: fatty acid desaturase [Kiloniellales bacterium]
MTGDFTYVAGPNCHVGRRREILASHPEVKSLMGPNRWSAAWIVGLVALQLVVASLVVEIHWALMLVVAYCFGAFVNHALYVLIHECTHGLVFKKAQHNKILGIICDFALAIPSAMAFRKYHLMHHKHLGQHGQDPDIVSHAEARLVGNSAWRKAAWIFFFSISQAMRPLMVKGTDFWDPWIAANLVVQLLVNVLVFVWLGPAALIYLFLSTVFALGLHPLGGRWIQEHYLTEPGQETYSYYGPLNKLCFNMGFHNEHHDFANVAWNNLPKLRGAAPEFYNGLKHYRSWTSVLVNFIFNPAMSTYSRIVHTVPTEAPRPARTGSTAQQVP